MNEFHWRLSTTTRTGHAGQSVRVSVSQCSSSRHNRNSLQCGARRSVEIMQCPSSADAELSTRARLVPFTLIDLDQRCIF
jgi:hypothetical protein